MRQIGVVTVGRSDYGIYLPILRKITADPELEMRLIVSGSHLSHEYGYTVQEIESDGFEVSDRVEMLTSSDSPEGISKSMGLGSIGFSQAYARSQPDILLVLGDRFEMHSAVVAALPFNIPVAHIHGGETTLGAIDEAFRHSITKMSHLHFVTVDRYAKRVEQLGEEPWRIVISGAPGLDNILEMKLFSSEEIKRTYALSASPGPLLVTFHPVTLEPERTEHYIHELLLALEESEKPTVFTGTNADTAGRLITQKVKDYVATHSSASYFENMGPRLYFSVMSIAEAMVGNSSSGLIEAASFRLPVVNVGIRQHGRVRPENVIDVDPTRGEIIAGIERATSAKFRQSISGLKNPLGDGHAAERIVDVLKNVALDDRLLLKEFHDVIA